MPYKMNKLVNEFRVASRELFNNHFLEKLLSSDNWDFYEDFTIIEEILFSALVTKLSGISQVRYGDPQPEILVAPEHTPEVPIMLNREIKSGYWDDPVSYTVAGCEFTFIRFFDWDQKSYYDYRYVEVIVKKWPSNAKLIGKHALIESHYVTYSKA